VSQQAIEKPCSRTQSLADAALLIVALIWGSTFVMVKQAIAAYPVFPFLAIRFAIGGLALALLCVFSRARITWHTAKAGTLLGLLLFGGYAFQTVGLQWTSASKTGFITGLSVAMVPVLAALLIRTAPSRRAIIGVVLATVGLALLTLQSGLAVNVGDLVVLGCAFCFALHVVGVGAFARTSHPIALAMVQITVVAILSASVGLARPARWPVPTMNTWLAAAFTGILATAAAIGIQTAAQRHTTPTHAALILTAEPVFAAVFGVLLVGETLTPRATAGGIIILQGMLASEIPWEERSAQIVSRFLAPQYVMIPAFILIGLAEPTRRLEALFWSLGMAVIGLLLPLGFMWRKFKRGGITDWHISNRQERLQPSIILASILAVSLPIALLLVFDGPRVLLAAFVGAALLVGFNLGVTTTWKISQHVSAISATATFATALAGIAAVPTLLLVPVVAWARVKVGAHTPLQAIAGGASGALITLATLLLFRLV
jgi:drug/metabolite transporter (DMT)-like permease/membrane-associated phospholipid phosphatase